MCRFREIQLAAFHFWPEWFCTSSLLWVSRLWDPSSDELRTSSREIYGSVQSGRSLAQRYVDHRLLITPRQTFQTLSVQLFWNLSFYMLEAVEGDEARVFAFHCHNAVLPWFSWKRVFCRQEVRVRQAKSWVDLQREFDWFVLMYFLLVFGLLRFKIYWDKGSLEIQHCSLRQIKDRLDMYYIDWFHNPINTISFVGAADEKGIWSSFRSKCKSPCIDSQFPVCLKFSVFRFYTAEFAVCQLILQVALLPWHFDRWHSCRNLIIGVTMCSSDIKCVRDDCKSDRQEIDDLWQLNDQVTSELRFVTISLGETLRILVSWTVVTLEISSSGALKGVCPGPYIMPWSSSTNAPWGALCV